MTYREETTKEIIARLERKCNLPLTDSDDDNILMWLEDFETEEELIEESEYNESMKAYMM